MKRLALILSVFFLSGTCDAALNRLVKEPLHSLTRRTVFSRLFSTEPPFSARSSPTRKVCIAAFGGGIVGGVFAWNFVASEEYRECRSKKLKDLWADFREGASHLWSVLGVSKEKSETDLSTRERLSKRKTVPTYTGRGDAACFGRFVVIEPVATVSPLMDRFFRNNTPQDFSLRRSLKTIHEGNKDGLTVIPKILDLWGVGDDFHLGQLWSVWDPDDRELLGLIRFNILEPDPTSKNSPIVSVEFIVTPEDVKYEIARELFNAILEAIQSDIKPRVEFERPDDRKIFQELAVIENKTLKAKMTRQRLFEEWSMNVMEAAKARGEDPLPYLTGEKSILDYRPSSSQHKK